MNERILQNKHVALKQCKHGWFVYNVNDEYIGRSLDMYGEWTDIELELLKQFLGPDDVVLDVGANIGTHTISFAKSAAMVHAFEPQRLVYQMLCANIAINGLTNVYCHNVAVGEEAGSLLVPVIPPEMEANYGGLNLEGHTSGERASLITIDSLQLSRCDLIKIDVEGMEAKVIKGSQQTIRAYHPVVFIENNDEGKSCELIRALHDLHYRCFWQIAYCYNPTNYFGNPENPFGSCPPGANMLCIHKSISMNIDGMPMVRVGDTWRAAWERLKNGQ